MVREPGSMISTLAGESARVMCYVYVYLCVGCMTSQEKIENFVEKYKPNIHSCKCIDIPVYEMRKIIPILVKYVYQEEFGQHSHKGEAQKLQMNTVSIFRSTLKSRPNNIYMGLKCPYVRTYVCLSPKSFFRFR